MKKALFLLTILACFFNCTVNETPEFIGVNTIKVEDSNSKFITLKAEAEFLNPNDIGGTLKTDDLKVIINNNEISSVTTESFDVPAKDKFTIPLRAKIPTDSLFSDKNLSSILGSLLTKNMKVQYVGDIDYKIMGFSHKYHIDVIDNVKIKL